MKIVKDETSGNVMLSVGNKTFRGHWSSRISTAVYDISKDIIHRFSADCLDYDSPLREIYNLKAHPEDVVPLLKPAQDNGYTVYLCADQHFFPRGSSVYPPTEEGIRKLAEDLKSGDVSLDALVFELADEDNILRFGLRVNMAAMTCRYEFTHEKPKTNQHYQVFSEDKRDLIQQIYLHELEWIADQYI